MLWCHPQAIGQRINIKWGDLGTYVAISRNMIDLACADASSLVDGILFNRWPQLCAGSELITNQLTTIGTSLVLAQNPTSYIVGDLLQLCEETVQVTVIAGATLTVTRGALFTTPIARNEPNVLGGYAIPCNLRILRQVPLAIQRAAVDIAAFNAIELRGYRPSDQVDSIYRQRSNEAIAYLNNIATNIGQFGLFPDVTIPITQSANTGAYVDASGMPVHAPPANGQGRNQ
jgi:hypothetical protein